MTKRTAIDWLSDMIAWGDRLAGHLEGISREKFLRNRLVQDAASKCAEAIGEAAGHLDDLDPALNERFPKLDLRLARRSRDRLSHGYYRIDIEILWNTVATAIPRTIEAAREALHAIQQS